MSGVGRHRSEQGSGCGPEQSDYTAALFRPKGCLDGQGPQAPLFILKSLPIGGHERLRARDRPRMAETMSVIGSVSEFAKRARSVTTRQYYDCYPGIDLPIGVRFKIVE